MNNNTAPTRIHILAATHHIETALIEFDPEQYTMFELLSYLQNLDTQVKMLTQLVKRHARQESTVNER